MTKPRIVKSDERWLYSRYWRRCKNWHGGQRAGIRRRVHKRDRRDVTDLLRRDPDRL